MFGKRWSEADLNGQNRAGYSNLFGMARDTQPPSFRELALVRDGGKDNAKFRLGPDPLEAEGRRREMIAGPAHLRKQEFDRKFNSLVRAPDDGLGGEKKLYYGKMKAKEQLDEVERQIDEKFINDFTEWLRGAKDPRTQAEHEIAGWNPATINGPISDHESVKRFLDQHYERRLNYLKKLAEMKMRNGRISAASRSGKGMTVEDAWNYYKYVVRNMPMDGNDEGNLPPGWSGGAGPAPGGLAAVVQAPQNQNPMGAAVPQEEAPGHVDNHAAAQQEELARQAFNEERWRKIHEDSLRPVNEGLERSKRETEELIRQNDERHRRAEEINRQGWKELGNMFRELIKQTKETDKKTLEAEHGITVEKAKETLQKEGKV